VRKFKTTGETRIVRDDGEALSGRRGQLLEAGDVRLEGRGAA